MQPLLERSPEITPVDDDLPLKGARCTHKYKHHILIFWFTLLCISAPFAPNLLRDTELTFTPPQGSEADVATKKFRKAFPVQSNISNLVILATTLNHSDIRSYTQLAEFSDELNTTLFTKYSSTIYDYQSYFSLMKEGLPVELASAFLSRNENGTTAAHPDSTIFILVVRGEETSKGLITFSEQVRSEMKALGTVDGIEMTLTGLPALYDGIMASAIHDLETMDSMVLPIALTILALLVWSFRLLIVPLAALGVSAALSFATVDGLTKLGIPILTAAPSLMASVFIAMSIDYSMFLLTRFQEEKMVLAKRTDSGKIYFGPDRHKTTKEIEDPELENEDEDDLSVQLIPVIAIVLGSSGKIIIASGTTLAICFAGLLALPLNLMQSIGLSCAVSLIYTMAVNLTLAPALIYTFPIFLTNSCLPQCDSASHTTTTTSSTTTTFATTMGGRDNHWPTPTSTGLSSVLHEDKMNDGDCDGNGNSDSDGGGRSDTTYGTYHHHHGNRVRTISVSSSVLSTDLTMEQRVHLTHTCWYKIALFTQSYFGSCFVILLTFVVVVPLGLNAFDGELSATMDAYLPRNGPGLQAISIIERDFAPGTTYPYRLFVGVGDEHLHGTSVLNETFIDAVQQILTDLSAETDPKKAALPTGTEMQSYMWATGVPDGPAIPYFVIELALKHQLGPPLGPFVRNMIDREFTNRDKTSAVVEIALGIPPFSVEGRKWLQQFRNRLKNVTKTTGLPMDVAGFGGDVNDSLHGVYSSWPIMAGGVCIVVLAIMGLSFKSVLIALRGVVTISVTIIFVSGLAKLAYCDGVFSFLGDFAGFSPSAAKSDLGMVWIVQPTIFPLMVGIALDYDIFLVGRICELHDGGMSTRDSILLGVASTGTIITAAGVIQGLAFFGLMMSEILVLNQLSFFLFFAVVFDTLVVRTLVVPSLMFWLGEANWWPTK